MHLAASQRVVRAQQYKDANLVSHFQLLALCSAGRDRRGASFEPSVLTLHARFYLRALRAFLGSAVALSLAVSDLAPERRAAILEAQVLAPVRREFHDVDCRVDAERRSGRGYYSGFCFRVCASSASGRQVELVDGGAVDWVQKLLSDAKEHTVISGIGSERVCSGLRA